MVPRAGFEPATTLSFSDNKQILKDLEDFRLFAKSKLNFSQGTVYHYMSKMRAFLPDRKTITDKDIQCYVEKKKRECCLDYVSNIISFQSLLQRLQRIIVHEWLQTSFEPPKNERRNRA